MKKKRTQKSPSGRPKPRTGLLGRAMADYGFRSVNALCGAAGTSPVVIGEIINGRRPLVSRWGRVNPQAVKVAELLGETPERLFGGPETTPVIPERPVTTVAETVEAKDIIRSLLSLVTDREREVLRGFYVEDYTLEELAGRFNVSVMRIRVIITRGLSRIRIKVWWKHQTQKARDWAVYDTDD